MIYGFAFRSPEVIKFLIPTSQYSVCLVPDTNKPNVFETAITEFQKRVIGGRKRVYLHKSVTGLVQCHKKNKLDLTKDYHIVFDALSILNARSCVRILDVETQNDANWQLKKTLSSVLTKVLESMKPGLDTGDLDCLSSRLIMPEDLISTDKRVNELEKQSKTKSFLHVIQDIQSKNASNRDAISFWICAFYAGALLDTKHLNTTKPIKSRWTDDKPINVLLYKEKQDKLARERMIECVRTELRKCGFELKKVTSNKIVNLLGTPEHITIMRALFLMCDTNASPETAANQTGANISAISLIWRSLRDRTHPHNLCIKHQKMLSNPSMPAKYLKKLIGVKPQAEVKEEATPKHTRSVVTGIPVPAGVMGITDILVHAKLAPGYKSSIQILASSKSPITTTAQKIMKEKQVLYRITKNKYEYIRYRGKKIKILGV